MSNGRSVNGPVRGVVYAVPAGVAVWGVLASIWWRTPGVVTVIAAMLVLIGVGLVDWWRSRDDYSDPDCGYRETPQGRDERAFADITARLDDLGGVYPFPNGAPD